MILDQEDKDLEKSFSDMLSFYGVQLQSHAGQIIGLAILIFAVVQAWGQLASAKPPLLTVYHAWLFSVVVGILGASIAYQILRLIIYGKLASALTICSGYGFRWHKANYRAAVKNIVRSNPDYDWNEFSDFRKISAFSSEVLKVSLGVLLSLKIFIINKKDETKGVTRSFWVLAASFAASFALSYTFIFGGLDWVPPSYAFIVGSVDWVLLFVQLAGSFLLLEVIQFPLRWAAELLSRRRVKLTRFSRPVQSILEHYCA